MIPFDFQPMTRIVFGPGKLDSLGEMARELAREQGDRKSTRLNSSH